MKKYDYADDSKEGLVRVKLNDKCGFINQKGEEIIALKYDNIYNFKEGLAIVKLNDKHGFINKEGEEVISLKYDDVYSFKEGFAIVELDNNYGFVNQKGEEVFFVKGKKLGSRNENLYYQKYKNTIVFKTGCFMGDKEKFIKAIEETHGNNIRVKLYKLKYKRRSFNTASSFILNTFYF